jgi:hypothetical protein
MRRIELYVLWCIMLLIAFGGAALNFVDATEQFSRSDVYYSILIEKEDNKIDSEESGSDYIFVTLIEFHTHNRYLSAWHKSVFNLSIFSAAPHVEISAPLLI